jgi:hypothetical protein
MDPQVTAIIGVCLASVGTAGAFVWNRVIVARITQLETELLQLRGELRHRDRLMLAHVVWDTQVTSSLRQLGGTIPAPPPLIPEPAH